jgi:hypothetical protein
VIDAWPDEPSRTENSGCAWVAECEVDGRHFSARSRNGAAFALARVLLATGEVDCQVVVRYDGLRGSMNYPSLRRMARRTITEGAATAVRGASYSDRPSFWTRGGKNEGVCPEGDVEPIPGTKAHT